jgi:hypothetical protein
MVVALAALVMSTGGTVTAAALITSANVKDNTIRGVDILKGTLKGVDVKDNTLAGVDVRNGSLTGADVSDGSLTGADLANSAVNSAKVANGSVTGADFANNAVNSAKVADGSLTGADVQDGSLTGADVADGSVAGVDVADDSLTGVDVDESTLGKVSDADSLDGLDSDQFVRKSDVFTTQFTCAGTTWENQRSTEGYGGWGSLKHGDGTLGVFRCNVAIPTGATVTEVSFAVKDTNPAQAIHCAMFRTNLTTLIGGEAFMAQASTSGSPGAVRISNITKISHPLIDNANFAYFVQCTVGSDASTGIYAAIVTYTMNAEPGIGVQTVEPAANNGGTSSADPGN